MILRRYVYGALLKPWKRKRRGKIAREIAGGGDWPPVFRLDAWPPSTDAPEGWPPRDLSQAQEWPGGLAWFVERPVFPREAENDPWGRDRDVDPRSPKGQWYAALDRNFPDWEKWDGCSTIDVNRE